MTNNLRAYSPKPNGLTEPTTVPHLVSAIGSRTVIKRCQQCRSSSPHRAAGYLIAGEWIRLVDANRMLGDEVVFEDVTCEDCQRDAK